MAKLSLGKRPQNFKRQLSFDMVDGSKGSMEVLYKYRTRKEFGALMDELSAQSKAKNEDKSKPGDEDFSLAQMINTIGENNVEYILKIAEGWNLDVEFDADSVQQLCDECPAASNAIMETYRAVVMEGRTGN